MPDMKQCKLDIKKSLVHNPHSFSGLPRPPISKIVLKLYNHVQWSACSNPVVLKYMKEWIEKDLVDIDGVVVRKTSQVADHFHSSLVGQGSHFVTDSRCAGTRIS